VQEVTVEYCSKSMTSIEDLSNELFYEIFEYLNVCQIYEAFYNLNLRFQNIFTYSSQPLKIDFCTKSESMLEHCCKQVIIPNKNRIISLRLSSISTMEKFLELIPINSSLLHRLESLILNEIKLDVVLPFLHRLRSLPRLFSLTLQIDDNLGELETAYQSVFCLPVLKYFKILSKSLDKYWHVWSPINGKYINSIEHLIIDHACTINKLCNILSYTPRLCYLNCKSVLTSNPEIRNVSINLPNLRYLSINNHNVDFDKFETFFKGINSQIHPLRFKTSHSMHYVNANRWEQLISQHMPHLHTFYLQCSITFNDEFRFVQEHEILMTEAIILFVEKRARTRTDAHSNYFV
jgi:hypothetical protein